MAINLASKFEKKTSEILKVGRKTAVGTNQDYSWEGVNAIDVHTLTDVSMGNYDAAGGANRYGNPTEVEDTKQTFTLSRDRSWTKTIDMSNYQDSMMIRKTGKFAAQTTKNVLIPEMDAYILSTIHTAGVAANRDDIVADAATSTANAYSNFVDIKADMLNNEAPEEGLVAFLTAGYLAKLKQSSTFDNTEAGLSDRKRGVVATLDGVKLVRVPSGRMPANCDLIITHPMVTVAPEKLKDLTVHKNPPGINGWLMEYRHRYDAFVDTNKVNAVGIHATA